MNENNIEKVYKIDELCALLNTSTHTLLKWYQWETRALKDGSITEPYLPKPSKIHHVKGQPKIWTEEQLERLREYKKSIVVGRNGIYGKYSNPAHKDKEVIPC